MSREGLLLSKGLVANKWFKERTRNKNTGKQTVVWMPPSRTPRPTLTFTCAICEQEKPTAEQASTDKRGSYCKDCTSGEPPPPMLNEVQAHLEQHEARGQVVKDGPLQFYVLEDWTELGMLRGMAAALEANPAAMPAQVCDFYGGKGGAKALLDKMVKGARDGSNGNSYGLTFGEVADMLAATDWQPVFDRLREGYAKAQRREQDTLRAVVKGVLARV